MSTTSKYVHPTPESMKAAVQNGFGAIGDRLFKLEVAGAIDCLVSQVLQLSSQTPHWGNPIVEMAMVIHEKPAKLRGQPTALSGAAEGCVGRLAVSRLLIG
ncbi:MAG TPA: hypothetical protein VN622_13190 [Clostridia bacterium]|nr:hypothetical protein [Clostridia bacterium]